MPPSEGSMEGTVNPDAETTRENMLPKAVASESSDLRNSTGTGSTDTGISHETWAPLPCTSKTGTSDAQEGTSKSVPPES